MFSCSSTHHYLCSLVGCCTDNRCAHALRCALNDTAAPFPSCRFVACVGREASATACGYGMFILHAVAVELRVLRLLLM